MTEKKHNHSRFYPTRKSFIELFSEANGLGLKDSEVESVFQNELNELEAQWEDYLRSCRGHRTIKRCWDAFYALIETENVHQAAYNYGEENENDEF